MRLEELERLATYQTLRTNRRELLMASGAAALLLAGCGGDDSGGGSGSSLGDLSNTAEGGGKAVDTVNWGIVADPIGLDPIGPNDYQSVQPMYQCFDTIVQLNEQNGLSPMIAESWEAADPTTYVYDIRSGVTFQDGSPMTVEDVAYSIQRHVDPENGSALIDFVSSVKSVETNGNNQVIVRLKEPNAMWKYIPALPVGMVVSQKNIEQLLGRRRCRLAVGAADRHRGLQLRVLGPWAVGEDGALRRLLGQGEGASGQEPGLPGDPRRRGARDRVARRLDPGDVPAQRPADRAARRRGADPPQRVGQHPDRRLQLRQAAVRRPRVRQAVSLATDKNGLLQSAYAGEGELWNSPVMRNQWQFSESVFSDAYDALPDFMTQDIERAKQLIQEAGAEGATGNIIASSTEQQAQAVAIQQSAEEIGLKLTIDRVSGDELIAQLFPEKPRTSGAWPAGTGARTHPTPRRT